MKFREDFVTNSSSSSYIVCFARVADRKKAQPVLDKYPVITVMTAEEVLYAIENEGGYFNEWLDRDWAGVYGVTPKAEYVAEHMDDLFVLVKGYEDIEEDEWGETNYYVEFEDFSSYYTDPIDAIYYEDNGFAEAECQCGAGRDG